MAKKKKEEVAKPTSAGGDYQAGALASFLLGNTGVGKDQTGGLFSAQAKAKVETVAPLPGFQDRRGEILFMMIFPMMIDVLIHHLLYDD